MKRMKRISRHFARALAAAIPPRERVITCEEAQVRCTTFQIGL